MPYIFTKKNKSKIILIIFLFIALNVVNSIYQSNNLKKEYKINLSLKHNIVFDFIDKDDFFTFIIPEEKYGEIAYTRDYLERYERILQIKMEEKIYYEKDFNRNLIEISKNCINFKIKIEGKYYFINCTTSNPNDSTKKIIDNLSIILTETLEDMELLLTHKTLNNLGLKQQQLDVRKFDIIQKKISPTNNIVKHVFFVNTIFIFIIILYFSYIIKFKKIIFR